MTTRGPLLVVVGPTASGKTEFVERLADRISLEAVAADAMQVYRGMDIGTAKPPAQPVVYHCIDVVDPVEPFSVARYQPLALEAISDIRRRGLLPVLVGGTGLYVRAVVDDLTFAPGGFEDDIRLRLIEEARRDGVGALYERLLAVDPKAGAKIPSTNLRRIVRALEWIEAGEKPSSRHERFAERPTDPHVLMIGLMLPRGVLKRRIAARVQEMLDAGLAAEVRELWEAGRLGPTAIQAIGYKELVDQLRSRMSREKAVETIAVRTRQYAKRQLTWFGRDERVTWLDATDLSGVVDHVAGEIARRDFRERLREIAAAAVQEGAEGARSAQGDDA